MIDNATQSEVEKLRAENEAYRQRELDGLRVQLAAALEEVKHYRGEAHRIEVQGRELHAHHMATIAELNSKLDKLTNPFPGNQRGTHAPRN